MAYIDRTTIIIGPAIVQQGGATFYTKDAIKTNTVFQTVDINTEQGGKVDERLKEISTEISFTPAGEWEAAALTALFPWINATHGDSALTGTDVPCVIWPLNSLEKITYAASFMQKMPDLMPASTRSIFGACTIKCMRKKATAWSDSAARATLASASFTDTSFSVTNVKTPRFAVALGALSAPWNDIHTKDGTVISSAIKWKPIEVDGEGEVDYRFMGLDISVKLAVIGPTVAEVFTLAKVQGSGAGQGLSLASNSNDLTIVGPAAGDPSITVKTVAPKGLPQIYGTGDTRHGELELIGTRSGGTGAQLVLTSV